jgi:hypothetical protein
MTIEYEKIARAVVVVNGLLCFSERARIRMDDVVVKD